MTSPQPADRQQGQTAVPPAVPQEPVSAIPPQPRAPTGTHHRLRRTRTGGIWVGLTLSAVVLLLLLVFILENGQRATVSYFGAHGHLPLGVALLLAAVAGALLVAIPGAGRIIQLRRTARRHRRVDSARQDAATPGGQPGNNQA